MTREERANLRALLEQATPGPPMVARETRVGAGEVWHAVQNADRVMGHAYKHRDARLIAAAVNVLPGLLDALDRAEEALGQLGRERNTWARQLADANDSLTIAHREAVEARKSRARAENERDVTQFTIEMALIKIEMALTDSRWADDGDGDWLARQIRHALDGGRVVNTKVSAIIRTSLSASIDAALEALDSAETPWSACTGASDCPESWHVHGCYADLGKCDDPLDHHVWRAES